jgi:hypothetical protein
VAGVAAQYMDVPLGVQVAEKFAVQSLPHPCALPLPHPPPSGHPREQPVCRGTIRQGTPTHQHEHDRRERCPVADSGRPVRCGVRSCNYGSTSSQSPSSTSCDFAMGHLLARVYVVRSYPSEWHAGALRHSLGLGSGGGLLRRLEGGWTEDLYGVGVPHSRAGA